MGKRTIAAGLGAVRGKTTNYQQVTNVVNSLRDKGCLEILDKNREGTLYRVLQPVEVPFVVESLSATKPCASDEMDYFNNSNLRKELYERDNWACHYCGEKLSTDNVTLDHVKPQHSGGSNTKENLVTACHECNSLKSGKTYDEAAPLLLKSISDRRKRIKSSPV